MATATSDLLGRRKRSDDVPIEVIPRSNESSNEDDMAVRRHEPETDEFSNRELLHNLLLAQTSCFRVLEAQAAQPKVEVSDSRKHLNSTMLGGCLVLLIGNLGYSIYWGGQKQAEVTAAASNITRLEQRIDYMQAQYESTGKQIAELKGLVQGMQPRQPQR